MTDESSLIKLLKAGDTSAFRDLVAANKDRVINTCYKFLLDKSDAEDVSQEVFIEVFRSIQSFRSDSKLSTWILRIAVSKSLDEIKKQKRKKRITSVAKRVHLEDLANWLVGANSPEKQLTGKEDMKEIAKAMDTLPDNQRIAFILSKVEGYANPEIAEIMNTTTAAVESLIYRAKKELIRKLADFLKND